MYMELYMELRRQQSCIRSRVLYISLACLLTQVKISGPCKQEFIYNTGWASTERCLIIIPNEKCDSSTDASPANHWIN